MNYFVPVLLVLGALLFFSHERSFAAGTEATMIDIALRDHAVVSGRDITLGDVADVRGGGAGSRALVQNKRVAAIPRIGYASRIGRMQVERALRLDRSTAALAFKFSGSPAVMVETASQLLRSDALIEASRYALVSELGKRYSNIRTTLASSVTDILLPEGPYAVLVRDGDLAQLAPRKLVWLDITVSDRVYRSLPIVYAVSASQPVYVARAALPAGSLVSAKDFSISLRDVAALSAVAPVENPPPQLGRLRKRLAPGDVLEAGLLAGPQAVLRGDALRLRVVEHGVTLDTVAVAQHDGELGTQVRVVPRNADEAVTARVVAAGLVQLEGSMP